MMEMSQLPLLPLLPLLPQWAGLTPTAPARSAPSSHARQIVHERLRVVREFEPNMSRSCAGRMVISGRMADVCAELERML